MATGFFSIIFKSTILGGTIELICIAKPCMSFCWRCILNLSDINGIFSFLPLSGLLSGVESGLFIPYRVDIKSQELLRLQVFCNTRKTGETWHCALSQRVGYLSSNTWEPRASRPPGDVLQRYEKNSVYFKPKYKQ